MMEIEGKAAVDEVDRRSALLDVYGPDAFPSVFAEFQASNGLVIRPLDTRPKMNLESERLKHCLASYFSRARQTGTHLFSVQDRSGATSFSSFEIAKVTGTTQAEVIDGLRVVQHRGDRNTTPSEDAQIAHREMMEAIRKGRHPANIDEINDWRAALDATGDAGQVRPNRTTWASVLEFDFEVEAARAAYWAEWGQVCGGRIAKADNPGVIYVEKTARDLVAAMSPRAAAIMIENARAGRQQAEPQPEPAPM